jgi:hypothetical protein
MEAIILALTSSLLVTKLPGPRGPRPVVLRHLPLAVSFGFLEDFAVFCDPALLESLVMKGYVTIFANVQQEICGIYKSGGDGIPPPLIDRMIDLAFDIVLKWHSDLVDQLGSNAPLMLREAVAQRKSPQRTDSERKIGEKDTRKIEEEVGIEDQEEEEEMNPMLLALFR